MNSLRGEGGARRERMDKYPRGEAHIFRFADDVAVLAENEQGLDEMETAISLLHDRQSDVD